MLGQTLAKRYKLTRILGAGGFGQTYLATDLQQSHQHQCVVKQLKPASQDASFLSVARRLFETEVKILNELGDHAQIPHLLDSFEEDNEFYLVQEFIDGQSLEEEIKQAGKFSESEVISLLEGVLPVLGFIHDHHVVHRDLKPDNLIRRKDDGKIVLIDFGAVKEIRTRLVTGEQTALTIGIGTQGYTPSEQLSGKPRYSSDLYALGMTAIHALTGRSPTALPEDSGSLDPQWEAIAEVSPGLAIVLGKMTRHYIYQRYQDVASVRRDLSRLEALPAEAAAADTYLETSMPHQSGAGQNGSTAEVTRLRWRMQKRAKVITVAISTVVTSALVLGLRHVGFFVPEEVAIYDTLINIQPDKGPDPRLLLVEVTDEDLRSLSVATPSDGDVASVIETLQKHQPASIGLDLLRDVPQAPGSAQLTKSLKMPNVVATTTLGDDTGAEVVLPPPGMSFSQVSFNNIVVDSDFRVRRALMLDFLDDEILASKNAQNFGQAVDRNLNANPSEDSIFALGIELAIRYLDQYHDILPTNADVLELNGVRFETLTPTFGGYQKADTAGYQMLLQYRSAQNVAKRIRFTDVLNNNFDPALVKDKIVLIGSTASSSRDLFLTPYNAGGKLERMPGVSLHAQVVSQVLSAVLEGETLPWAWPDWAEVIWIVSLTGIGSVLMVLTHRGLILITFGVSGLTVTLVVGLVCFYLGGWVPIATPMNAFFLSAAGTRISKSYQRRYWEARQP